MTATIPSHVSPASRPRDQWRWLSRRWPTAIALAFTVPDLLLGGSDATATVSSFGQAMLLLPLLYLVVAKLDRRGLTWPLLFGGLALMVALRALDVVAPIVVVAGIALLVMVWGALDRELQAKGQFRIQAVGMVGFAVLTVTGLAVDVELGAYLIAAAWFLHGVWDFVHLWRDKVVARSFAEWCGVIDVVVAAQLVLSV